MRNPRARANNAQHRFALATSTVSLISLALKLLFVPNGAHGPNSRTWWLTSSLSLLPSYRSSYSGYWLRVVWRHSGLGHRPCSAWRLKQRDARRTRWSVFVYHIGLSWDDIGRRCSLYLQHGLYMILSLALWAVFARIYSSEIRRNFSVIGNFLTVRTLFIYDPVWDLGVAV